MSKSIISDDTLTAIADAIREKTGNEQEMTPAEMANAISEIPTGGGVEEPYVEYDVRTNIDGFEYVAGAIMHGFANIPNSIFKGCGLQLSGVEFVDSPIRTIGVEAFNSCSFGSFDIPATVRIIGADAFSYCNSLRRVTFPPTLDEIRNTAFRAAAIREIWIPSVTEIWANAFLSCTSLTTAKIGQATTIASSAFSKDTALTDIYVSWAEGAVDGAPWGATKATIHYDTTFDSDGNIVTGA